MTGHCREQNTERVPLEEFLPLVMVNVPKVPEEIAEQAVRSALIEFAKATHSIRRLYYADVYKSVENYIVEPTDGYHVNMLQVVKLCDRTLPPLQYYPDNGHARGAFYEYPNTLYVFPAPTQDMPNGLEVELSLFPGQDSCEVDREFFDQYAEAVAEGALSRLLGIPDTDWYDRSMAGVYFRKFKSSINRTKLRWAKRHQAGPLVARPAIRWY